MPTEFERAIQQVEEKRASLAKQRAEAQLRVQEQRAERERIEVCFLLASRFLCSPLSP
jgi:hypothetical protein